MVARRVLVIEDHPGARDALGSLLSEDGYLVRTAATGRLGLAIAAAFRPDAVVCDCLLPDGNGLRILRALRAAGSRAYFILVTATCGDPETERALRREADLFLDKPIDLARFRAVLQRVSPGDGPGREALPPLSVHP